MFYVPVSSNLLDMSFLLLWKDNHALTGISHTNYHLKILSPLSLFCRCWGIYTKAWKPKKKKRAYFCTVLRVLNSHNIMRSNQSIFTKALQAQLMRLTKIRRWTSSWLFLSELYLFSFLEWETIMTTKSLRVHCQKQTVILVWIMKQSKLRSVDDNFRCTHYSGRLSLSCNKSRVNMFWSHMKASHFSSNNTPVNLFFSSLCQRRPSWV